MISNWEWGPLAECALWVVEMSAFEHMLQIGHRERVEVCIFNHVNYCANYLNMGMMGGIPGHFLLYENMVFL